MLHHRLRSSATSPPAPPGQQAWTTPGTYSWAVPDGVTSVSIVCIGGGANSYDASDGKGGRGGAAGALAYSNNVAVSPGETLTIIVPASSDSFTYANAAVQRSGTDVVMAQGARRTPPREGRAASSVGEVKYSGGSAGLNASGKFAGAGGGGAAGYTGNGGKGGNSESGGSAAASGGGGGGGGGGGSGDNRGGAGGGGAGIVGAGTTGGPASTDIGGRAGSGASNASNVTSRTGTAGTSFGAGGGGGGYSGLFNGLGSDGSGGAVRILWGEGRAYPNTDTADV